MTVNILIGNFFKRGLPEEMIHKYVSLPKLYAQYSDMFIVGMLLDENNIRNVYQMEIMKIRLDKSYMVIWQIHALSSVLNVPIFSIYPKLGNPNVRKDMNRLVLPRNNTKEMKPPRYILWTKHTNRYGP